MSAWIEYNRSWKEFCDADLNQPGTQIEVQDAFDLRSQHTYIVGSINRLGGACDCCQEVLCKQTVIRYRRIKYV